jgi:hypothetical protein
MGVELKWSILQRVIMYIILVNESEGEWMDLRIETYRHFGRCLCITNHTVELKIPLQYGIRIISFALKGRENIFYEQPSGEKELSTPEGWRIYGGHRIWVAPESNKTYYPDNQPIAYSLNDDVLCVEQPVDEYLNIIKTLEVKFDKDPACVWLRHKIKNVSKSYKKLGIWTISAMAYGAVLSVPFAGVQGGYSPQRFMSLWGNTDICDPRLCYEADKVVFRHDDYSKYFKMGLWCQSGEAHCISRGQVLEKRFDVFANQLYPDNHVNVEVFQCKQMMEFEVLSPLVELAPNEEVTHLERWRITDQKEAQSYSS